MRMPAPSATISAQEQEFMPLAGDYDFLAVKGIRLYTTSALEYGELIGWNGKGLHVGIEQFDLTLFNCKDIPQGFKIPDNPELILTIKDPDGNIVDRHITDLTNVFRRFTFVKKYSIDYILRFRSGQLLFHG